MSGPRSLRRPGLAELPAVDGDLGAAHTLTIVDGFSYLRTARVLAMVVPLGISPRAASARSAPATPGTNDEPSAPSPSGPRIVLRAPTPHRLELFELGVRPEHADGTLMGRPFQRLCTAPCDTALDVRSDAELFIGGPGMMPSKRFSVDPTRSTITIDVRRGSKALRTGGLAATVLGAVAIPGGIAWLVQPDAAHSRPGGFTLLGLGVASLALGIVLIVRSRTRLSFR